MESVNPQNLSTPHTEQIACPVCGAWECVPFRARYGLGTVRCGRCGLVYVNPRPTPSELSAIYDAEYFQNQAYDTQMKGYLNYEQDEEKLKTAFRNRLNTIGRYTRAGNMLDIGCAVGFLVAEAQHMGWHAQGIDTSAWAIETARARFGQHFTHADFLTHPYPPNHYDLITLWETLEHVPDPQAYVRKAARLLKTSGVISVIVPDIGSLPAKVAGRRWIHYKAEHITYFSYQTLARLLSAEGFTVLDRHYVGKPVTYRMFLDRLNAYAPWAATIGRYFERTLNLSDVSFYANPLDTLMINAQKIR